MVRARSETELAAGKLISAIQKEWGKELGWPGAEESEAVMSKGHDLLQAGKAEALQALLAGRSVAEYIGCVWLEKHASVKPAVDTLEQAIARAIV